MHLRFDRQSICFMKSGARFTKHLKAKIFLIAIQIENLRLKMFSETGTRCFVHYKKDTGFREKYG